MKRRYDLVLGIGGACCCSQALRAAGLQYASFPFDWVALSDIRVRADQIRDDFADWLPGDAMERYQEETTNRGVVMRNVRTGIVFPHDFHRDVPYEEEWPQVAAKYRRRADRLARLVAASGRVLVVWVDVKLSPPATDADCRHVLGVFRKRWPGVGFDFLHFRHEEGRRFSELVDETDGDVRTVAFDYRDRAQSHWIADHGLIGRWLRAHYEVVDRRTPEERAEWKERQRRERFARFAATGWIDYWLTKFGYKLFVHLRKRLAEKGLA